MVLFPAPVRPTIPTFEPPSILKFRPFRTSSVLGLYLSYTLLNSTVPLSGQEGAKIASYSPFMECSCGI